MNNTFMLPNRSACIELKTVRQSLLLSIDDAHEALNISKEYLEILEDPAKGVTALAKIIAPVYAHGYYRIYTQYLGIQQPPQELQKPKDSPVKMNTDMVLRKPTAMLKEDSAINKVIPTVCALVVLVTVLILAR
jgi:cytoskeletal protein RodZ